MLDSIITVISGVFDATVSPVYVLLAASMLLISGIIYKLTRPRYPVRVSCWFCMSETVVPYGNQNCWDCPCCEQYNGFTKDGGYNKPIPAQHVEDLNYPVRCKPDVYLSCQSSLCSQCEQNQLLKIKQLAAFTPISEDAFECEIVAYERHLEREYDLCADCRQNVDRELRKQDDILRVGIQGTSFDTAATSDSADLNSSQSGERRINNNNNHCVAAAGRVVALLAWLVAGVLVVGDNVSVVTHVTSAILTFIPTSRSLVLGARLVVGHLGRVLAGCQVMFVVTGLMLSVISKVLRGRERLSALDLMDCLTWLASFVGSVYPTWIGPRCLSVVIATNFLTTLVSVIYTRARKKGFNAFKRVSLDQSETTHVTESDMTPVSSNRVDTTQQSVSTSRQIEADDLDLEFNAMSVDPMGLHLKRNDSGIFSSTASLSSVASVTRTATDGKPRPIIMPAKLRFVNFGHTSLTGQHKNTGQTEHQKSLSTTTKKQVPSGSQDNLFQLSFQSTDELHLFDKEYMQAVPVLKPSPLDSPDFPQRMTRAINAKSLFTGGLFSQNVAADSQEACGQFAKHTSGSLFSQNAASNSQFPQSAGNVFSQKVTADSREACGQFAKHTTGSVFTQNAGNVFSQCLSPVSRNKTEQFSNRNTGQSGYSPNEILRKPRLFNSAFKTASSFKTSQSPVGSRSQFLDKLPENLNFGADPSVRRKVYCANAYADNPFGSLGNSRTCVKDKSYEASGYSLRSRGGPCGYDSIATLQESLLSEDISNISDSSQCDTGSTNRVQTDKKGFSWTSIGTILVLVMSILANAGLAVYMYVFSTA